MQVSATIALLAVVVEQVTGIIKNAVPGVRDEWSQIIAIFVGITLSVGARVGVLVELNVPIAYPLVDYIITGLLISRGSNLVHEMVHGVNTFVESRKK